MLNRTDKKNLVVETLEIVTEIIKAFFVYPSAV